MAKRIVFLLISALLIIGLLSVSVTAADADVTIKTQYTDSITLDTSWFHLGSAFDQPTTTYDTTLSRASAILAVGTNRRNFNNMKATIQTLGFGSTGILKYATAGAEETYATGFYTASKAITRNGHPARVFLVCIGDNIKDESVAYDYMNTESGNTNYQQELVLTYTKEAERIFQIIQKDSLDNISYNYYDYVIWVTGYGRGASIGDYLSVLLNKEYGTSHVTSYLFGLSRVDTSYNAAGDSNYYNIFGIKSRDDFFSYLPLSTWNRHDWWGTPVYFGVPSGGDSSALESELNTLYQKYTANADSSSGLKLPSVFRFYSKAERNGVKLKSMITDQSNATSLASIIPSFTDYYTGTIQFASYSSDWNATRDKYSMINKKPYDLIKELFAFMMQDEYSEDTIKEYLYMVLATYKRSASECPISDFVRFVMKYGFGIDNFGFSTIAPLLADPTLTMGELFVNSLPEVYLMYTSLSDPGSGITNLSDLPHIKYAPADSMTSGGITITAEATFYPDNRFTITETATTGVGYDIFFGDQDGNAFNPYDSVTMTVPRPEGASKTDVPVMYYPEELLEADRFYHPRVCSYDAATDSYTIQLTKLNGSLLFKERLELPTGRSLTYDGFSHDMVTVDGDWSLYTASNAIATDAKAGTAKIRIKNLYRYEWNDNTNSVEEKSVSWSMAKRPLTIKARDVTVTFDGEIHTGDGYRTGGWGLAKDADNAPIHSISGVTISGSGAEDGSYALTPSGAIIKDADGNDVTENYEIAYETGTLTITDPTLGTVTYSWNGNLCTAQRKRSETGSPDRSETVTAAYEKDSDASCLAAESGHYVATFTDPAFTTQRTEANSVSTGDPLGHGGWTYSANGAVLTASCGHGTCEHITS